MIALSKGSQLTVSSGAITPTHDVHHVTGTTVDGYVIISTINPPNPGFCGNLYLIGDNNLSFHNDGNIAAFVSFGEKRNVRLTYDPDTSLWYVEA